jgi:hypothetical protein
MEFRQICVENIDQSKMLTPVKQMLAVTMFYMNHDANFAMSSDYWSKKVRYFMFADCYHDWKEISATNNTAWNCYHYCKCSKCGASHEYDSSG